MTDKATQRCTATTILRADENDPGKCRTCELPLGHSDPHSAEYCGVRREWSASPASPAPYLLEANRPRGEYTLDGEVYLSKALAISGAQIKRASRRAWHPLCQLYIEGAPGYGDLLVGDTDTIRLDRGAPQLYSCPPCTMGSASPAPDRAALVEETLDEPSRIAKEIHGRASMLASMLRSSEMDCAQAKEAERRANAEVERMRECAAEQLQPGDRIVRAGNHCCEWAAKAMEEAMPSAPQATGTSTGEPLEPTLCPHGRYRSRCVDCGAKPLNASIGTAPAQPTPDVFSKLFERLEICTTFEQEKEAIVDHFGDALDALRMIGSHPCHASDKKNPDWHCGECAACVAQEELARLRQEGG